MALLGSARSNASDVDFLLVILLKSPRGVPGEKGDPGVLDPAGEAGAEPELEFRTIVELLRRMVMLRDTGISSVTMGGGRTPEKESYFRSLPRPDSGFGPARVSSHSLSRKPILESSSSLTCVRCFCNNRNEESVSVF